MENKNAPAMPIKLNNRVEHTDGNITINECDDYFEGLTKREYFAAKAMQGILSNGCEWTDRIICETSVSLADTLLEALEE